MDEDAGIRLLQAMLCKGVGNYGWCRIHNNPWIECDCSVNSCIWELDDLLEAFYGGCDETK